ncbi:hypothetical protein SKAU_G00117200 [Synaphobranchus kaupii]|uniref:Uncharacterized protein n=1 Tax=Synaphobranchus kaupii TaxID=118154 RepID=A0A9Q1FN32_SYNKA|nr:hypothetical protein SKAU_G00117200 [Synaphobranchus kaupii]
MASSSRLTVQGWTGLVCRLQAASHSGLERLGSARLSNRSRRASGKVLEERKVEQTHQSQEQFHSVNSQKEVELNSCI